MQGFLYKRGRGRNISFVKPWTQRLFVLDPNAKELTYFALVKGTKQKKGNININGCLVCETTVQKSGKLFSFEITGNLNTDKEETLVLAAADDDNLIAWLNALWLSGLNEIRWLQHRTSTSLLEEDNNCTDTGDEDFTTRSDPDDFDLAKRSNDEMVVGVVYRKVPLDSKATASEVWVRRKFSLDAVSKVFTLFNESGKSKTTDVLNVSTGSLFEGSEKSTGRPHSFCLICKGKSVASKNDLVVLAGQDSEQKAYLLSVLSVCMECDVSHSEEYPFSHHQSVPKGSGIKSIVTDTDTDSSNTPDSFQTAMTIEKKLCHDQAVHDELVDIQPNEDTKTENIHTFLGKIQSRLKDGMTDVQRTVKIRNDREGSKNRGNPDFGVVPQKDFPEHASKSRTDTKSRLSTSLTSNEVPVVDTDLGKYVKVDVLKVLSLGKYMRKYLHMKEFFSVSASLDRDDVIKRMIEYDTKFVESNCTAQDLKSCLSVNSCPSLPGTGCTLDDVRKIIFGQAQNALVDDDVVVSINFSFAFIGYSCRLTCRLKSWADQVFAKLKSDAALHLYSISDIILKSILDQKAEDVQQQTMSLLSLIQFDAESRKSLEVNSSKKYSIIQQVLQNAEKRELTALNLRCALRTDMSYEINNTTRTAPPRPPSQSPDAVKTKKSKKPPTPVVPPRNIHLSGGALSGTCLESDRPLQSLQENIFVVTDSVRAIEPSGGHNGPSEKDDIIPHDDTFHNDYRRSRRFYANENFDKNKVKPKTEIEFILADQTFVKFKRVALKNKWCKISIRKLTRLDRIRDTLEKRGNCISLICSCCPSIYLGGHNKKTAKCMGMSVVWLEAIATRLGTFWALSEREFLVEKMYEGNADGDKHVSWLSALFILLQEKQSTDDMPENL